MNLLKFEAGFRLLKYYFRKICFIRNIKKIFKKYLKTTNQIIGNLIKMLKFLKISFLKVYICV